MIHIKKIWYENNNWLRNTTPYGLTLDNVSYDYFIEPYKIYDEVIDITSTSVGTIDSVGIVTGGSGYQVGDRIVFETLPAHIGKSKSIWSYR